MEAYREEQLINRLMRQSQQERRIAVQLMHVRHEKEVLWQNRIFREKQYEERRLKDFQDALDREAALAKQAKLEYEEQAQKEIEIHERIAAERAQARYKKHYSMCTEILDDIIDLSTKVAEYRNLTHNLIPIKIMRDWKELFFSGKPIYEQASIDPMPTRFTPEQLVELSKRTLLDDNDYEEYKTLTGEWAIPEEMADAVPPSNNNILGHVLRVVHEKVNPPKPVTYEPQIPSFSTKGCMLGKTCSGKTSCLKILEEAFHIEILSIDTLVQEAIQAFLLNETITENTEETKEVEKETLSNEISDEPQESTSEAMLLSKRDSEIEDEDLLKIPPVLEVKQTNVTRLSNRAQLGEKCEKLLKKGKSIPDVLLIQIMVNAINQVPVEKGWILDGFPMTLNQAKLLEEALTGCNPDQQEQEGKNYKSTLASDPTAPKDPSSPPPALDFAMLLDITDTMVLKRVVGEKRTSFETSHGLGMRSPESYLEDQEKTELLRDQIQHRILGFLDNWPELEKWFSEKQDILIKINAEVEKRALATKVQEYFIAELREKEAKAKKKLEEEEAERKKKEEALLSEPPPPPAPEPEKGMETEKEIKGKVGKGKIAEAVKRESPPKEGKGKKGETSPKEKEAGKRESPPKEGKGKKDDTSPKGKVSPKGKGADKKGLGKKSPVEEVSPPPPPPGPPPVKPGSEEWVYVDEPLPPEIPRYLVPFWETIENSYINTIKAILRQIRDERHNVLYYLHDARLNYQEFLQRPDHKQEFVSQWQDDYNNLPEDLWDDEETKAELHQRVNDLRDRLWDICDTRKEEAEQERAAIIDESWLQDHLGILMNHFFSLMQVEVSRFQDTKRLLQDYYRGIEGKIPIELAKSGGTRVPLINLEDEEVPEIYAKIPVVPRKFPSLEGLISKTKSRGSLKRGTADYCIEVVELKFEVDEKTVMNVWQNANTAINSMVANEINLKKDDESESKLEEPKEKSPQQGKGVKTVKKKEEKKKKAPSPEIPPVVLTPEEQEVLEKQKELKMKIRDEHLTALQCEAQATQFRLELIKNKTLSYMEELLKRAIDVYKLMDKWLGARYLAEMASVEKLTEVAHYHIETSTKIQYELILNGEDFYINGDVKVFPDPLPPVRPPAVEKEVNTCLTIKQLNTLRQEFMEMAPKGYLGNKHFTDILYDLVTLNLGTNHLPEAWLHLTVPELQEITTLLTVNSEFVDWRKFLLVVSQPWPLPSEEELLQTLKRFKEIDKDGMGSVTQEQYKQVGLWFTGDKDVKIPEDPLEPLPYNRPEHLIEFFFDLFADFKKDPPEVDYFQMLLYFACHPNAVEGIYRALSLAIGTHVFRKVETRGVDVEHVTIRSDIDTVTIEGLPEVEETKRGKEKIIVPEFLNKETISIPTLLKVFQSIKDAQDNHRFFYDEKMENTFFEIFKKVYQVIGSNNMEPVEVASLLKHPFIQDLLLTYKEYKLPNIKGILQRVDQLQVVSEGDQKVIEEKK
ncbi:sperm flagellar protein 2 isoform X8 [Antechinus flavipes]|uniref:sperm flagellar protein 2 isoform X8 n=1 Tax=Antechinus flavipes TaxID=38775 RepID=UPI002235EA41|nr:sperm flagellar protein 2 isoform X8 [Antechinus flavipes]